MQTINPGSEQREVGVPARNGNLSTVRSSLLVGLEGECTQEERSTSITKQLVFSYRFCRKTSCNRVLERFLLVE
jgi:hypothetical protein